jgi:hypothetical protein
MAKSPAQCCCRFSFLLLTMKPCPRVDASGIFFRDTELANNAKCLPAVRLRFEPVLKRSRKRRPHAIDASADPLLLSGNENNSRAGNHDQIIQRQKR